MIQDLVNYIISTVTNTKWVQVPFIEHKIWIKPKYPSASQIEGIMLGTSRSKDEEDYSIWVDMPEGQHFCFNPNKEQYYKILNTISRCMFEGELLKWNWTIK